MEMERFELLTLLSLQQPFFQKNDMIIIQGYPYKAISYSVYYMGLSGLEPPTSRLSGVRSNRLSYEPIDSGDHLLSQAASHQVPSTAQVLTVVFGMGTGVSPERIITGNM